MYMPPSPGGHTIEHIEGEPATIELRGSQIETLGTQMRDSAKLLEQIKTRAGDQQGKAIKDLRDTIGDSYQTLFQAANLYEPVGPIIKKYGSELSTLKPQIDSSADTCEDLWQHYASLPGQREARGTGGLFEPDEGSEEAEQQAEEDAAKKAAYEAWRDEALTFDGYYDNWEEAFDAAVDGVTDETSDAIEDGFWRSAFDFASSVLSWAALAAGVLALIFTGPFAAIALAIGAAYLATTLVQKAYGDASWGDVAWAAVGVLPVGKVGGVFKKGAASAMGNALKRGGSKAANVVKHPGQLGSIAKKGVSKTWTGTKQLAGKFKAGGEALANPRRAFVEGNPAGISDVMSRATTGTGGSEWETYANSYTKLGGPGRGAAAAITDVSLSHAQQLHSYYVWGSMVHNAVTD